MIKILFICYKTFDVNDNVTSVVIPVNEEYYEIKKWRETKERSLD